MNSVRSSSLGFNISVRCKYLWTLLSKKPRFSVSLFDTRTKLNACTITGCRSLSSHAEHSLNSWCESSDKDTENTILGSFKLIQTFINEEEEKCLLKEAERYLKKIRYEYDHWDDVIILIYKTILEVECCVFQ